MRLLLALVVLLAGCGAGLEELDPRPLDAGAACPVPEPDGICKPPPKVG